MKILVIDDSPIHREAAEAQLGADHDLTVVGSYEEGQKLLEHNHGFEVVFADLLMPGTSMRGTVRRDLCAVVGQEMPIGIFLALLAAKNGAKHVAVFTDSSHHEHPASACFDAFNTGKGHGESWPAPFTVAGATVILSNARQWIEDGRKDWAQVLHYMLGGCKGEAVRSPFALTE